MTTQTQPTRPGPRPPRKFALRPGKFRYSAVELLVSLVLLFVSAPLVEDLRGGDVIEALLVTVVMVFSVLAVGARRRTMIVALALLTPALVGKWLNHLRPDLLHPAVFVAFGALFFSFVVVHLLQFVFRARRVDTNVLCAGIAGFLMLGLLWTSLYVLVARLNPAAFSLPVGPGKPYLDGFSAFYFSFVTLTTVGYGDITPVSRMARMLAVTEAVVGLFYNAVLISRLVAIHSTTPPAPDPDAPDQP